MDFLVTPVYSMSCSWLRNRSLSYGKIITYDDSLMIDLCQFKTDCLGIYIHVLYCC